MGTHINIEINPFEDNRHYTISVYKQTSYSRQPTWEPAQVNWLALGSQPVETTCTFVAGLAKAIEEAHRLDQEYPSGSRVVVKEIECDEPS